MRLFLRCIFSCTVFFSFLTLYGNEELVNARRYSVPEGLSHVNIKCFFQDSRGFIWIGTEEGLCRFDGYEFQKYVRVSESESGLTGVNITALVEGDNGDIWIGTTNGLNILNRKSGTFTHFMRGPEALRSNIINSLCRFPSGRKIWIGTDKGIEYYDLDRKEFRKVLPEIDGKRKRDIIINNLYADKRGNLWIGTHRYGVIKYNELAGTFTRYSTGDTEESPVLTITEDRVDNLWIGSSSGLYRYIFSVDKIEAVSEPSELRSTSISSIISDHTGKLWIGTKGKGLFRMDVWSRQLNRIHHSSLMKSDKYNRYSEINAVFVDRNKNVWSGTEFSGLYTFNILGKKFRHIRGNLPGETVKTKNFVYSITEDEDGNVWVGTYRGLELYNKKLELVKLYEGSASRTDTIGNSSVKGLLSDSREYLWVATMGGGISWIDKRSGKIRRFKHIPGKKDSLSSNFCKGFLEDRNSNLWLSTEDSGLNLINREKGTFRQISFSSKGGNKNNIYAMFEDPLEENILWLGTYGAGLCKYNTRTGKTRYYTNDPEDSGSLSHDSVIFIDSDEQGQVLWIGTYGGGLCRFFKSTGKFQRFTTDNGLKDNYVYSILKDGFGFLWLSTNSGIARFNPRKQTFRYYTVNEGVQALEFNGGAWHRSRSGRMYMGGVNGFNVFYPEDVVEDNTLPDVRLTGIRIDQTDIGIRDEVDGITVIGSEVSESSTIHLSPGMKAVEIEFSALHYADPAKNEYAYKLVGFDYKWNHIGTKRTVTFHNLPGGDYEMLVKASNSDKVWNENPLKVRMIVKKPFTETVAFELIVHSFGMIIIAGLFFLFLKRLRKRNSELIDDVKSEQRELESLKKEINRLESGMNDSVIQRRYGSLSSIFVEKMNDPQEKIFSGLSYVSEQIADVRNKIDGGKFSKQSFDNWFDLHKRSVEHLVITAGRAVLTLNGFEKMLIDYMKYEIKAFNLGELINKYVDSEKQEFGLKNIDIRVTGKEDVVIESYPQIITEILGILMNNSLLHGFCHYSEGEINVEYYYDDGNCYIIVRDNGAGIPAGHSEEIFEPLFTTRRSEGFQGVGLYILKNHVEVGLKGILKLKSHTGKTAFTIEFPCERAELER